MEREKLREAVKTSLENAAENGFDMWKEDPSRVASDLLAYDADLEDQDHDELTSVVRELQGERAHADVR